MTLPLRTLAAVAALVGLLAASPAPSPSASAGRTLTVTCVHAPLYLWPASASRPNRTERDNDAMVGQRFALVSGPRATLDGFQYYETDVPVVQTGPGEGEHYWISSVCVIPS